VAHGERVRPVPVARRQQIREGSRRRARADRRGVGRVGHEPLVERAQLLRLVGQVARGEVAQQAGHLAVVGRAAVALWRWRAVVGQRLADGDRTLRLQLLQLAHDEVGGLGIVVALAAAHRALVGRRVRAVHDALHKWRAVGDCEQRTGGRVLLEHFPEAGWSTGGAQVVPVVERPDAEARQTG
jgi:hypothetical protein